MTAKCCICFLLLLSVAELVGCNNAVSDHEVDVEVQKLTLLSASSGLGSLSRQPQVSRSKSGVDAEWQITTNLRVGEYLDAVRMRLNSDYQVVQQSPSELRLRRLLPGDSYDLHLAGSAAQERQTIITIHFAARPD